MGYGVYVSPPGPLHRADPTAKIISLAAWFVVGLVLTEPVGLFGLAILTLILAAVTGLIRPLARFWKFMAILFGTCTLFWGLFSAEGSLLHGVLMGVRLTTMLSLGLLFLASTRVEEIATGLQRLGVPFMAAFSLTLAFRLLPLFAGSGATIVNAQACRGLDPREGNIFRRLRRYLPLLVPLVLSSLRSADGMAAAIESRGLGMHPTRTSMLQAGPGIRDWIGLAVSLASLAGVLWWKLAGNGR